MSTVTEALEARGLVLDRLGERPRLARLTVAPPGPGEVRVRMLAAGLCHTDVTQLRDARFTPILLGHEALERLWELRQELPREQVPPVQTPAWIRHLEAFREGDWPAARAAAEEKTADPAA